MLRSLRSSFRLSITSIAVAVAGVVGGAAVVKAAPTVVGLGDLPGGSVTSSAFGMSNNGTWVVGKSTGTSGNNSVRWSSGTGLTPLTTGSGAEAYGVSDDGSLVVGTGFRWTQATGAVAIPPLPGGTTATGKGVSGDGSVIVGYGNSSNTTFDEAFRYTQANGTQGLGDLPGGLFISRANAVSHDGNVVVGFSHYDTNAYQAFRWQGGVMSPLGFGVAGDNWSEALGTNGDGSVVVGYTGTASFARAFKWTQATGMVALNAPSGLPRCIAYDVSDDGSIVVGHNDADQSARIWINNGPALSLGSYLNSLGANTSGWTFRYATAISGDGATIAGYGDHNGNTEAFIITGVPEPMSLSVLALAALTLIRRRREFRE